ncbi:MAG: DUF2232 domain-containing protein [Candidatus Cloacimonetes bacterium]|nr:DUF2232 domain-containing protein [Candidatus Cloacimonadota bacterium]
MFLIAVLSALIATLSPFWGLIFILALSGKYQDRKYIFFSVFAGVVLILIIANIIDIITFFDLMIGVGLSSIIYFGNLFRTLSYLRTILAVFFLNVIYAILRHILFGKMFLKNFTQVIEQYKEFFSSTFQDSSEQLELALELLESFKYVFSKFYMGIWVVTIVFAIYFGSLILSKKMMSKWNHKEIRQPFFLIYILIGSLVLFLIPNTKIFGINMMVMLAPLFLIQGISILDFYWGNFFKKSKFLLFLLIFSMVLNYFILMLVVLMGLLDIWFNFRKIRITEEADESNLS